MKKKIGDWIGGKGCVGVGDKDCLLFRFREYVKEKMVVVVWLDFRGKKAEAFAETVK